MRLKTKNKLKKLNEVHLKKLDRIRKEWNHYWNNLCNSGVVTDFGWESELREMRKWINMKCNYNNYY